MKFIYMSIFSVAAALINSETRAEITKYRVVDLTLPPSMELLHLSTIAINEKGSVLVLFAANENGTNVEGNAIMSIHDNRFEPLLDYDGKFVHMSIAGGYLAPNADIAYGTFAHPSTGRGHYPTAWKNGVPQLLGEKMGFIHAVNDTGALIVQDYPRSLDSLSLWIPHADGSFEIDPLLPLENSSFASSSSLNFQNTVVGSSTSEEGHRLGTIWFSNGLTGTVGLPPGYTFNEIRAINDLGDIVGNAWNCPPTVSECAETSAWIQVENALHLLPPISGYSWTTAKSINNDGTVLGESIRRTPDGLQRAVTLWKNLQAFNLNTLVEYAGHLWLHQALQITNSGYIRAFGTDLLSNDGAYRTYVLKPVAP